MLLSAMTNGSRATARAALPAVMLIVVGVACSSSSDPAETSAPASADTTTTSVLATTTAPAAPDTTVTPDTTVPADTTEPPRGPFRLGLLELGTVDYLFNGADPESFDGPAVRSALLAVKHINDAGGVFGQPVEPYFGDSYIQPHARETFEDTPVAYALSLIEDEKVHAFVGPGSSHDVLEVSEAVVAQHRIPFVSSVASAPYVADLEDDGFIFRTNLSDAMQGQGLAQLAYDEGYVHVALVYRDNSWGQALAEVFKSHYRGEVTEIALHPGKESYEDELHEVSASNAPVLISLTFHDDMAAVMEEVAEHGHFENFLLNNFHRSLDLLEAFPILEGAKGVAPVGQHVIEAEGHWEADYEAEYGDIPHVPYMRETYDAAIALMLAAEYAGSTDGEAIRDALHVVAGPPGKHFPASSEGVVGALEAVRNGEDIDLDGEATDLNWDDRGEIVIGHMLIWQFNNGAIEDIRHFGVDLSK